MVSGAGTCAGNDNNKIASIQEQGKQMNTLVGILGVQLDMSLVEGRLQSFTPRTRRDAIEACKAVFERTCAAAVYIDPGTTWRFLTCEGYFTIEAEAFHDCVVIHDIEIAKPRDYSLGAFVVWYDNSLDFHRIPASEGPINHIADWRSREKAFDDALTHLLIRLCVQPSRPRDPSTAPIIKMDSFPGADDNRVCASNQITFDPIGRLLGEEAHHRRSNERILIMTAFGDRGRAALSAHPESSLRQLLHLHNASSRPTLGRGAVACRDLFGAGGRETPVTERDIGIVIGALLFGTAAGRLVDPGVLRPRISHAIRTLMHGSRIKSSRDDLPSAAPVMTLLA